MKKIILKNKDIKVEILPEFGGKISSIILLKTDYDIVAPNTRKEYIKSFVDTAFSERDASGLDDAFPTIDGEELIINNKKYIYTDHGEIWRSEFDVLEFDDIHVLLKYYSKENNYTYLKEINLLDNTISITYNIENNSDVDYPCLWAFHGLMKYEEDMVLKYPKDTIQFINACEDKILGKEGNVFDINNDKYNFNKVLDKNSLDTKKYYVKGKINDGYCSCDYPSKNTRFELFFDKTKLPYLGVWITSGGYRGDYNFAFEPANGYYDSISKCLKNGTLQSIKGNSSISFDIKIVLNSLD